MVLSGSVYGDNCGVNSLGNGVGDGVTPLDNGDDSW